MDCDIIIYPESSFNFSLFNFKNVSKIYFIFNVKQNLLQECLWQEKYIFIFIRNIFAPSVSSRSEIIWEDLLCSHYSELSVLMIDYLSQNYIETKTEIYHNLPLCWHSILCSNELLDWTQHLLYLLGAGGHLNIYSGEDRTRTTLILIMTSRQSQNYATNMNIFLVRPHILFFIINFDKIEKHWSNYKCVISVILL